MGIAERLARQLAHPHGFAGQLLGGAMDLVNRKPVTIALDLLDARPGEAILDAGCGTGEALRQLVRRTNCRATGFDPSATMVAAARRRLDERARIACSRIEDWPGTGYDGVLALNVLYFAQDDGTMLRAIRGMVRPGGRLVAYVTDRSAMSGWGIARAGLHRLYDEGELVGALCDAGFAPAMVEVRSGEVARGVTGLWALART